MPLLKHRKKLNLNKTENMNAAAMRQRLHNYLAVADEKKVKAIYAIMENEIEQTAVDYTEELKTELDKRVSEYKNGKSQTLTAAQSKKRVEKILQTAKKSK